MIAIVSVFAACGSDSETTTTSDSANMSTTPMMSDTSNMMGDTTNMMGDTTTIR